MEAAGAVRNGEVLPLVECCSLEGTARWRRGSVERRWRLGGAEGAAGLGQSSRPFPSPRASSKGGHPVLPQLTCG